MASSPTTTSAAAANSPRRQRKRDPALGIGDPGLIATTGADSVAVAIRVRPFSRRELELHEANNSTEHLRSVIEMPDGVTGKVRLLQRSDETGEYSELETFQFTKSFWSIREEQQPHKYLPITQEDVYETIGAPVVQNALLGYASCIFAYGQTGAGKSYSMTGSVEVKDGEFVGDPGIIPRMCREIFKATAERKKEMEEEVKDGSLRVEFDIKLSAIEIYNEQVKDLYWKSTPGRTKTTVLKVRTHPTDGAFVDQLTVLNPKSWEECLKLIGDAITQRTVAATLMNAESSRSHSVFVITITTTEYQGPPKDDPTRKFEMPVVSTRSSRINLVDLAGSERLKKSGAQGQQLKEAAGINLSLSTLKKVIDALVDNSKESNPKKQVLVPYRESTLTMLLSHSLGGNSKTTMIACVSPHHDNTEETLLTLRYANRTKGIVNNVKCNEDNSAKQAQLLKDQIARLQARVNAPAEAQDPKALEDLRDQIAIGEKEMADREVRRRKAEEESERIADRLRQQKDARYSAAYYNAFKRVWLSRQRATCEKELGVLEGKLRGVMKHRESLSERMIERERNDAEAKLTMEDLKRKESAFALRNARNQAKCRELSRDIKKSKVRAEEMLSNRFASVFVRSHSEKAIVKEFSQHLDAAQREHGENLSSLNREAKKQFDTLVSDSSDRELVRQERLEAVERQLAHANAQLEKSEQLHASAAMLMQRAKEEYADRESERDASWLRRYEQMQKLYSEKAAEFEARLLRDRYTWAEELSRLQRGVKPPGTDPTLEIRRNELAQRIAQVQQEGEQRARDVEKQTLDTAEAVFASTAAEAQREMNELTASFAGDEAALLTQLRHAQNRIAIATAELQRLSAAAVDTEDAAFRTDNVLAIVRRHPELFPSVSSPTASSSFSTTAAHGTQSAATAKDDSVSIFREAMRELEVFHAEAVHCAARFELPRINALIKRSLPLMELC